VTQQQFADLARVLQMSVRPCTANRSSRPLSSRSSRDWPADRQPWPPRQLPNGRGGG